MGRESSLICNSDRYRTLMPRDQIIGYHEACDIVITTAPTAISREQLEAYDVTDQSTPLQLRELGVYYLKCLGKIPDFLNDNCPYVRRSFPEGLFEIGFRNCVGLTRIGPIPVVVGNKKLSKPAYQSLLDAVVSELASLIFGHPQPTGQNIQRGEPGRDVAYLEMCFIRQALCSEKPNIDGIAASILANPHRKFLLTRQTQKIEDVTDVDVTAWQNLGSQPQYLASIEHNASLQNTPLGQALKQASGRDLFPRQLTIQQKQQTLDTPENRFVKYVLTSLRQRIEGFRRSYDGVGGFLNPDLDADLAQIEAGIRRFAQAPLWRDVGQMRFFPASSQILQRRDGYRQLFRLFSLLSLRSTCVYDLPDFSRIIETKDSATLYEYWAFFVVKGLLDEKLGPGSFRLFYGEQDVKERHLPEGLVINYNDDVRLYFNRSYPIPLSYSHKLRPDIVIEKGPGHACFRLILDAKFKGKDAGFYGTEEDDGTIKRWNDQDIDKMHTYRDAITGTSGAFIIYPGCESAEFVPPDATFPGTGAIALRPADGARPDEQGLACLRQLIDRFIKLPAQPGASG